MYLATQQKGEISSYTEEITKIKSIEMPFKVYELKA